MKRAKFLFDILNIPCIRPIIAPGTSKILHTLNAMDPISTFTTDTETTFQHQDSLPSLPIPTLDHTLNRYLDSVHPLVSEDEYRNTEEIVKRFESGIGKDLHNKLMNRAKHQRNWLEKWWDDKAYLEFRLPLAPLINIAGPAPFRQNWSPREGTQTRRAALWLYYAMEYWTHVRKERLKPDRDSKRRIMSMNQYWRSFNTCRIPGHKIDQLQCHFKTESQGVCPSHVVVFCRGRIFSVETCHSSGDRLTAPELEVQFNHIRSFCDRSPRGQGIGSLTGDHRSSWAKVRSQMISRHPENWNHLQTIEKAVVAVVLDESSPADQSELLHESLAGDSSSRWFDKSCSYIIYKNGMTAAHCDHTPFEGVILISSLMYVGLSLQTCDGEWKGSVQLRDLPKPRELVFHIDDDVTQSVERARLLNKSLADSISLKVVEFEEYGKRRLRGFKLHPDTHVQLAIQYAYYKTYNRPAPTYETATTRQFYNGRTETLRSCTTEALVWCKAMLDSTLSSSQKHRLYMRAADKHNQLMTKAQNNQGCDRHLFGLMCIAEENNIPLPEIFNDVSYRKSGGGANFILSTSFLGYTPGYGGVAPMCENGYCVAYSIENTLMNIVVSSWTADKETNCVEFSQSIQDCLREMMTLIQSTDITARL